MCGSPSWAPASAGFASASSYAGPASTTLSSVERSHAVGGTWRDNTYPGCACDVPSHLHSYSFEPRGRLVATLRDVRGHPRLHRPLRRQVRSRASDLIGTRLSELSEQLTLNEKANVDFAVIWLAHA
jgi:cation diffusion facilitator CzcD-associated flavoprotein CzcO